MILVKSSACSAGFKLEGGGVELGVNTLPFNLIFNLSPVFGLFFSGNLDSIPTEAPHKQ